MQDGQKKIPPALLGIVRRFVGFCRNLIEKNAAATNRKFFSYTILPLLRYSPIVFKKRFWNLLLPSSLIQRHCPWRKRVGVRVKVREFEPPSRMGTN